MQHVITPYSEKIETWAYWDNALNAQQLNWLQHKAKSAESYAQVGSGGQGVVNHDVRRTKITWVDKNSETAWLFENLGAIVSSLNANFFRFDLTGFGEHIQLGNYDSVDSGMYGWHVDRTQSGPNRKLSIVLQLSDPVDYEGGVLELRTDGNEITRVPKRRGLLVAFPSWTLHQVTPVTQGSRQSLVAWISGPAFK